MNSARRSRAGSARRFKLPRPLDPGERSAGAQRLARRAVPRRHRRRALGQRPARQARDADAQSVLRRLCGRRGRRALRAGLPAGHRRDRLSCPTSTRSPRICSRARSLSSRVARKPARLGRRSPPISRALSRLRARFGFLVFSDECYSEIYTQHAPAGMLEAAAPDFANVVVFQSLSKRSNLPGLRIGFAAGDRNFLARFLELRNVAAPQVPVPAQRVAIAAYGDEDACRGKPPALSRKNSISPTRSSATVTATAGRPAASSLARCLRAWRRRGGGAAAVAGGWPAGRAGQLSRARAGRRHQSGRRLHPRRHGAGPRRPRPKRCTAWSRCWVEDDHAGHRPRHCRA